ncbi:MAG: stage III sporulation protein AF [Clostridium sp.]|jgi:stage III sporulation protein AF|uniref:Stage III sporulation protein AF n=1 Tax=Clostridium tertium TaxID=1559 RepID=A0A9X4B4J1_9CLOT|nr:MULTISPECIES: stage III sporulation protein AF [Clostridium]MBS5885418.1 stage III sporulation protein AF [Clostridium sp.]MBU6135177.1 stage III sporulation protein AF [Clostridium tertium]MDC4242303.1 stage III sporulation protein AF [Clostridium tertium]MDI9216109.1 stage III sporulation protein AF [Clostridium tertium]MDU7149719.1 stage III sporulation protein AF [Clostridium sp.]
MEEIKGFVITLVTMLILMTAIEFIAPDNNMKKYLKFVLGLILISVMLSPIISLFSKGEESISLQVQKYIELSENESAEVSKDYKSNSENVFKENLEQNCNRLLKEKFTDKEFVSNIDCEVDMNNINYSIDKVQVGVKNKDVSKIQKIIINTQKDSKSVSSQDEKVNNEDEIISYLAEALNVSKDKIEVYKVN